MLSCVKKKKRKGKNCLDEKIQRSNWMDTVKSNNLRDKIWNVNKDANKSIEI